jgi:hypothetical protein
MLHSKMSSGAAKKSESVFQGVRNAFFEFQLDGQRYGLSERHRQIQVGPSPPELYVQRVGRLDEVVTRVKVFCYS